MLRGSILLVALLFTSFPLLALGLLGPTLYESSIAKDPITDVRYFRYSLLDAPPFPYSDPSSRDSVGFVYFFMYGTDSTHWEMRITISVSGPAASQVTRINMTFPYNAEEPEMLLGDWSKKPTPPKFPMTLVVSGISSSTSSKLNDIGTAVLRIWTRAHPDGKGALQSNQEAPGFEYFTRFPDGAVDLSAGPVTAHALYWTEVSPNEPAEALLLLTCPPYIAPTSYLLQVFGTAEAYEVFSSFTPKLHIYHTEDGSGYEAYLLRLQQPLVDYGLKPKFTMNRLAWNLTFTNSSNSAQFRSAGLLMPLSAPMPPTPTSLGLNLSAAIDHPHPGFDWGVVTVAATFPQANIGTDIWVTFPDGFRIYPDTIYPVNDPAKPLLYNNVTRLLAISGTATVPEVRFIKPSTLQLRWPSDIVLLDDPTWTGGIYTVLMTFGYVGLPHGCTVGPAYKVETHTCHNWDVYNAGVLTAHLCKSPIQGAQDFIIQASPALGYPLECDPCTGCVYQYTNQRGDRVFSCLDGATTYLRVNVTDVDPLYRMPVPCPTSPAPLYP